VDVFLWEDIAPSSSSDCASPPAPVCWSLATPCPFASSHRFPIAALHFQQSQWHSLPQQVRETMAQPKVGSHRRIISALITNYLLTRFPRPLSARLRHALLRTFRILCAALAPVFSRRNHLSSSYIIHHFTSSFTIVYFFTSSLTSFSLARAPCLSSHSVSTRFRTPAFASASVAYASPSTLVPPRAM